MNEKKPGRYFEKAPEVIGTAAILLYDGVTTRDWVGPYHSLNTFTFDDLRTAFVAKQPVPIKDDRGRATVVAKKGLGELSDPDVLIIPGGGQTGPMRGSETFAWVRSAHAGRTRLPFAATPRYRGGSLPGNRLAGRRFAEAVQLATEYDLKLVFGTGDAATEQPEVHRIVRELLAPTSAASKVDPDRTSRRKGGAWGSNR